MKFHVVNLGCKVNKAESDAITANLLAQGNSLVGEEEADTIIINTCTVTGDAEKKTRKAVRHALRENLHASVIVTGCAAVIDPGFYQGLDPRISVVQKDKLTRGSDALRVGELFPQRVSVKVQDGCNHACTYCIVHIARGKAWSRPLDEIGSEVRALEAAGIHEVMLSGIDLGSYSYESSHLDDLLEMLLESTDEMRFRISSIEPCSISDRIIDLMANAQGRICRHLHVPLQAGSSKVLSEMNRPYDAAFYGDLVDRLYAAIPELSLSTDIIVGFPGETDEDYHETLKMAKHARFSKIHAFRYSMREGTPAAARSDQIDPRIKEQRLRTLLSLADELRLRDAQRRIGTTEEILIEQPGIGTSESYFRVEVPADLQVGSLVPLSLTVVDSSCIMRA